MKKNIFAIAAALALLLASGAAQAARVQYATHNGVTTGSMTYGELRMAGATSVPGQMHRIVTAHTRAATAEGRTMTSLCAFQTQGRCAVNAHVHARGRNSYLTLNN